MLKVCLTVDVEGFISFKQGNPRWNKFEKFKGFVNNLIKDFRYNREGFKKIYNLIVEEKFPVTFMLTKSKFKPLGNEPFIEWGSHTVNHLPLTLISDDQLEKELENKENYASMTPPMWMIEDVLHPERVFKVIKSNGFKTIVYRGRNKGVKHFHENKIIKPFLKYGVTCVNVSAFFEGNSRKQHLLNIIKRIESHFGEDAVCCITTHDFTHRNTNNLNFIIDNLKKLEKQRKIKLIKLSDLIK